MCGLSWSTMKSRHAYWIADHKVNVPVQAALRKDPDLPDVPLATDLAKDGEQAQIVRLILTAQEMARPFAAPPGIPADRARALIEAFDKTMKDPEYLADAKKLDIDVNPVSGKELDDLLAELYATPRDVTKKAGEAITK